MKLEKRGVSLMLSQEDYDKLKRIAEKQGVSITSAVRMWIRRAKA